MFSTAADTMAKNIGYSYVENVLLRLKLNMIGLISTVVLGKVRSDETATSMHNYRIITQY